MTVFIQQIDGQFANVNTFSAYQGFIERGSHVEFFETDALESLDISPDTPVVGGIPIVQRALSRLGVEIPLMNAVPPELAGFAGRKIWDATLSEVRFQVENQGAPVFIKPLPAQHKLFAGHVVARFRDFIETAGIASETVISCSETVAITSEYRAFVHYGEIVGFKHYAGDFRISPDFTLVQAALDAWQARPVACSMDWGVTEEGRTLLIEVNDAYSLGCYGLNPLLYAPLIADRWFELTGSTLRA
ncbi:protein of unknown function (DUF4343) [Abditibacterium utsteinense]|uniref:ATP-grasp domain-containing protein n=1 Tax=Abditibacterium utsteinense TaxID=1960156 RepID=A0A2S8SRK8_9BACT|nr:ATP-grasp domain-containing protein [Abditibacterium utsteinense]PQV63415.1 protein of unknown function (DUF4343) [Abditibacterium utsteinense]